MSSIKNREIKEAPYIIHNKDVLSVCNGSFYIKCKNIQEPCKNREKCQKYAKFKDNPGNTVLVGFRYVDSFRKCDLYKENTGKEYEVVTTAIYNILYVNDLACSVVIDLTDHVEGQDKETRKIFGALIKRQKMYENIISQILGSSIYAFAEYNDSMDEHVKPMLASFRDRMIELFRNLGEKNYMFIALVEVARTLVGYSVCSIENRIKECLKYQPESVNLRHYRLDEMKRIVESLSNWVTKRCPDFDLNTDEELVESYKRLDGVLTNAKIIGESVIKSREYENHHK